MLSGIPKQDSIFIGHIRRYAGGYGGVHGDMGFGTRNAEGVRILELGDAVSMVVCNTFFKKEDSKPMTYQSGDNRSMIDYLMVRKTDCCLVKVIAKEEHLIKEQVCFRPGKSYTSQLLILTQTHRR